jgi:phage shock protein PspC (stress-responsive transcriptional regulator)
MKKTLQMHIGGRHFHIDEDAFNKLNHYLESLKSHFAAEGESGKEIMEDIEQRVAELLENKLSDDKQAISLDDVHEIIGILGQVEDFVYTEPTHEQKNYSSYDRKDYRRLYRDEDNNYLGGVAAGLGAYFNIDPLWIRLIFIALIFVHFLGILIYAILWIVVPKARTTSEKLQMHGVPVNLSTIKESVTAEYSKVKSSLNNLSHSHAADQTRNAFENLIRACGQIIVAIFKFIIGFVGIVFIVVGSLFLAGLIMVLLGFSNVFSNLHFWHGTALPDFSLFFANSGQYYLVIISLAILILIPIAWLIYLGIKVIFNINTKHKVLGIFTLTAWILAFFLFITMILVNGANLTVQAIDSDSGEIKTGKYPRIYVQVRDNTNDKEMVVYSVFNYKFNFNKWDESLYTKPDLLITRSEDQGMYLTVEKKAKNVGLDNSQHYLNRINYRWEQKDSVIYIDRYFATREEDFWMFAEVDLNLSVPENQVIVLSEQTCELLIPDQYDSYCSDSSLVGRNSIMTTKGLMLLDKQKRPSKKYN